jgi:hypothetical protein
VIEARLRSWAAWAPGLESAEAWRGWARDPGPLERTGRPDVSFLPAMQRRRCDALSRAMLHVANACLPEEARAEVTSVFASRHGGFSNMIDMLEALADDRPLSPTRFSHSVHNTPAGLFSIWAGNRRAAVSMAAGGETFACGFLEALGLLGREPGRDALLVVGDEPIPPAMAPKADHDPGLHAVALLLGAGGPGEPIGFELAASDEPPSPASRPDAIEFVRWWLAGGPRLRISRPPRTWAWQRG